jgi:hypothetical protein
VGNGVGLVYSCRDHDAAKLSSYSYSSHHFIYTITVIMTRVAAIQAAPVSFDLHKSVAKLQKLVAEAKANGAELVQLPEVSSV